MEQISLDEASKYKAEKQLIAFEEQGFFIEKVKDGYLIFDDINGKYLLIKDKDFEEKVWKADEEIFTKVEKLLDIKEDYEIFHNVDGINIFCPDFTAIDATEDEEWKYKGGIKYKKKGDFILAVIPYELYIKWLYELLGL